MKSIIKKVIKGIVFLFILLVVFVAGATTQNHLYIHFTRRYNQGDKAQELLNAATALRSGETDVAQKIIDESVASSLLFTAHDVDYDKMAELPEELLWVWQQAKKYYEDYEIEDSSWLSIKQVKGRLSHVPWSEYLLAQKVFEEKYSAGKLAPAPEFNITHWFGKEIDKQSMQGKVILLDFWNVYCSPCVKSMPNLQKIYNKYKDEGFAVVACAGGFQDETTAFLKKHGYSFPTGIVDRQTQLNFAVAGNPTYFMINKKGQLAWGPTHELPTDEEIKYLLEQK